MNKVYMLISLILAFCVSIISCNDDTTRYELLPIVYGEFINHHYYDSVLTINFKINAAPSVPKLYINDKYYMMYWSNEGYSYYEETSEFLPGERIDLRLEFNNHDNSPASAAASLYIPGEFAIHHWSESPYEDTSHNQDDWQYSWSSSENNDFFRVQTSFQYRYFYHQPTDGNVLASFYIDTLITDTLITILPHEFTPVGIEIDSIIGDGRIRVTSISGAIQAGQPGNVQGAADGIVTAYSRTRECDFIIRWTDF